MNSRSKTWMVLTCMLAHAVASAADPPAEAKPNKEMKKEVLEAKNEVGSFWNVSAILNIATRNIGRRYNLNEEQQAFTDEMMTTRVTRFLEEHQDEIWPLIRDLAYYQRKGAPPDAEEAKRIGPTALKIVMEAKKEIYESNEEWRQILSDEQRRVHDYDLREMDKTFAKMEGNFEQWTGGNPKNNRIFPQPPPPENQPQTPSKPKSGLPPRIQAAAAENVDKLDNHFDAYVETFIRNYELNATQKEAAYSILREIKKRAAAFRTTNKDAIQELKKALGLAKKLDDRKEKRMQLRKLTQPLNDLFAEFKDRLDPIPEVAQRERFDAKSKKRASRDTISSSKIKRPPAAGGTQDPPEEKGSDDGR